MYKVLIEYKNCKHLICKYSKDLILKCILIVFISRKIILWKQQFFFGANCATEGNKSVSIVTVRPAIVSKSRPLLKPSLGWFHFQLQHQNNSEVQLHVSKEPNQSHFLPLILGKWNNTFPSHLSTFIKHNRNSTGDYY